MIGVVTTGIYCRPGCPARAPKPDNVRRFSSGAAARAAGFRACKRCRPEGRPAVVPLGFSAPFDGPGLIRFLARRAVPGVEEAGDGWYRRSLRLPRGAGVVELRPGARHVKATFWLEHDDDLGAAVARSRALLDLDRDPRPVAELLGADPLLAPVVRAAPGRRVPGHVDPHELALRAVLGQQVSLAGAATLAGRLVAEHGERLTEPVGRVTHLFPSAAAVAGADGESLAMPRARRAALLGMAAALARGDLVLDAGDPVGTRAALRALPGIGTWTAEYIAMRALADPDAFPATDLGVRHALDKLHAGPAAADHWRPYRSYAVQHLWEGVL